MRFKPFYFAVIFLGLVGCMSAKYQAESTKTGTKTVLDKQVLDWNKGDIPAFMQGYWKSDSLQFIGKSGITYGWEKTLANYQKSYPNAETMGQLTFTILHVDDLNPTTAYVTIKWQLNRSIGNQEGFSTLLFRRIDNEWKIISDHSS